MRSSNRRWLSCGALALGLWLMVGEWSFDQGALGPGSGWLHSEARSRGGGAVAPAGPPEFTAAPRAVEVSVAADGVPTPPGDLFGNVQDADGKTIENASVVLRGEEHQNARTDDRGRFEFLAVHAGKGAVDVSAAGHMTREGVWLRAGNWRSIVLERAGTVIVEVKDGAGEAVSGARAVWVGTSWELAQTTNNLGRVELRPRTLGYCRVRVEKPGWRMSLSDPLSIRAEAQVHSVILEPTPVLRGRVVMDKTGQPLGGASLTADGLRTQGGGSWTARTDAQGRFSMPHTAARGAEVRMYVEHPLQGGLTTVVTVPRSAEGIVLVRLAPPLALTGRVVDLSGQPVAGAEVFPLAVPSPAAALRRTVRTDTEGRFDLRIARPVGRTASVPLAARHPAGGYGVARLTARAPGTIRLLGVGRLTGRVAGLVDGAASPTQVRACLQGRQGAQLAACAEQDKRTSLDGDGRFVLPRLTPGPYIIHVLTRGGYPLQQVETTVVAGANQPLRVQLPPRDSVRGIVRNAEGDPLPGAWVFATPEDEDARAGAGALADSAGRFELTLAPRGLTWTVSAQAPGLSATRIGHVQAAGRTLTLRLSGQPAVPLKRDWSKGN